MHETSRASHYDTHVLFLIKKNEVGATYISTFQLVREH